MNLRILAAVAAAVLSAASAVRADDLVYVAASQAIEGYRLDTHNGRLKPLGPVASLAHPTFLLENPDHRFLYAAAEAQTISAFLIDPKSGKLAPVNQISSKGGNPCQMSLDRSERWLAVANCGGNTVAVMPMRKDGGLGEARTIAVGTRAYALVFSPDNRFLLVSDQGSDQVYQFRFNAENGSLTPADPAFTLMTPGAGVGRLVFHPNGRLLFAIDEMRGGVTAYHYDPDGGTIEQYQTIPVLGSPTEIAVNPAGARLYVSNGASANMALLVVDPVRFTLSMLEYTPLVGKRPRYFALDPSGAFLIVANQDSNNITVYTVHPHTGQLRPAGRPTGAIDRPGSLAIVPAQ